MRFCVNRHSCLSQQKVSSRDFLDLRITLNFLLYIFDYLMLYLSQYYHKTHNKCKHQDLLTFCKSTTAYRVKTEIGKDLII